MSAWKSVTFTRASLLVAALLGLSGCAMHSRNPTEVTIYHGKGTSQAIAYEVGAGGRNFTSQRQLELDLPEGSRVCLSVINAHTPFFNYSFRTAVDSSVPEPPSFGNILPLLNAAVAGASSAGGTTFSALAAGDRPLQMAEVTFAPRAASARARARARAETSAYETYRNRVRHLENSVSEVRAAIVRSVLPEILYPADLRVETNGERGLAYAQAEIARQSDEQGEFSDPRLAETLAAWRAEALDAMGGRDADEVAQELVNAVHARALTLLAARNAIVSTYSTAPTAWRDCRALSRGKTTIHLAAAPRESGEYTGQRDTGNVVQIVATSDYRRDVLEIVPLAFLAFPRNVTGFGIVNDNVVEDRKYAEEAVFRVGTMLTTSPWRFGSASEWAVGPGIGTGIIGGDKPALSDFFLGGLISWRDWIRMGGGYGFSQAPARLTNGAQVGQPLPLGEGRESLKDFIEQKRVGTWFLTFTLTGLKLNP